MCSCPVHVDARKRSKGERPDAKDDDVRLAQRQRPSQQAQQQQQSQSQQQQQLSQQQQQQQQQQLIQQLLQQREQQQQQRAPQSLGGGGGLVGWLGQLTGMGGGGGANVGGGSAGGGHCGNAGGALARQAPIPSLLMDAAGDSFVEVRPDGVIVRMLSSHAFGYTPAQLLGRSFLSVCHKDDHAGLLQTLQALLLMASARSSAGEGPSAGGADATVPPHQPPRAVRVAHRVLLGLGAQRRQPESIAADSIISLASPAEGGAPPQTLLVCSRSALPASGDTANPFSFRVVPWPLNNAN